MDPHLSWYGPFRFYEIRLYGGELAFSGACIVGLPFPALGHSRYTSIAMTPGGPDTSDVDEEEVKDGKYKFRDEWRPLETRHDKIAVKVGDVIDLERRDHRIHAARAHRGAQGRQILFSGDSLCR